MDWERGISTLRGRSVNGSNAELSLSTRRITFSEGNAEFRIIPLESVDSFAIEHKNYPSLSALAAVLFILGISGLTVALLTEQIALLSVAMFALVGSVFSALLYIFIRKSGLAIYSLSGRTEIFFLTKEPVLREFVEQVQRTMERTDYSPPSPPPLPGQ